MSRVPLMTPSPRARSGARRRAPLLAALLAALLPALSAPAPAQEGGAAEPAAGAPAEKELLTDFTKAFKSNKAPERTAAITALGDMSRSLEDQGASKAIAKALAQGLEDEELEVRAAAVGQLSWSRHVDTVIAAFKGMLEDQRKQIDKRITRPDPESREYVTRGTRVYHDASRALANYRDDRSAEILQAQVQALRPNTDGNNLSTRLVGDLARALLSLGTYEAVEIAVKQTSTYSEDDGFQEPAARSLHDALAEFATQKGAAPPEFNQTSYVAWDDWFEKNGELFPKKLGKLEAPPTTAGDQGTGMDDPPDDGGPAAR